MASVKASNALLLLCLFFLLPTGTLAFGAGTIKSTSTLSNYNARHGDLANLLLLIPLAPGKFFNTIDVKRVYFGNWLRDYSQLFDVAGLTTIPEEILIFLVQIIAYMQFGYCTGEFEVNKDRVGVYRPEEHMDNPKGYPDNANRVDLRLRGPVLPEELEYANEPTNMKNYFNQSFQYIERQIALAIQLGRSSSSSDRHEAMRYLGSALHTLEDFPAHTNYVEICLQMLATPENGLNRVFTYVGPKAPPAKTVKGPPIVSGTFGPLDMLDSLLGEVNDMITTGSISEFSLRTNAESAEDDEESIKDRMKSVGKALAAASSIGLSVPDDLMSVFKSLAGASTGLDRADWGAANQIPIKVWKGIRPFFALRDKVSMWIEQIDWKKVLGPLYGVVKFLGQLSSAVDMLLYAILGYVLRPVVSRLRETLIGIRNDLFQAQTELSGAFSEVESDPSHSLMAKDHYDNILNVPAAQVAAKMSKIATAQVTAAWNDHSIPPAAVIWNILSMVHHPLSAGTAIQKMMFDQVQNWWAGKSPQDQAVLLERLTPEAILGGQNHQHPHSLINPAATGVDSLGIPKEADYLTQGPAGGVLNRIIENLWRAHDTGNLGKLGKSDVESITKSLRGTPSPTDTNPFDSGLGLLPINPDVVFAGISAQEIMSLNTMGNIAKTGVLGALRDNEKLGPVRAVKGLREGENVVGEEEFADIIQAIRLLGPEAEPVAREWEGMIRMVVRV